MPVNVLMYRANNGAYSRLMERLDPTLADAIIEIGTPEAMLRVRESLDRGEMVGILADRAPAGQKMLAVPFLGEPAPLPTGPLSLCAALGAPVVLFSVSAPERGDTKSISSCSPTASSLQRSRRAEDMAGWVIRYARRLETYCRIYPFNWFNFYDFWDHGPHAAPPSQVRTAAVADAITGVGAPRGGGTIATTAGCRDR